MQFGYRNAGVRKLLSFAKVQNARFMTKEVVNKMRFKVLERIKLFKALLNFSSHLQL